MEDSECKRLFLAEVMMFLLAASSHLIAYSFKNYDSFLPEVAGALVSSPLEPFFTHPFNMSGQPAASIPVGLQIVGRRFAEKTVLRASACFETTRPWADRWPAL